MRPIPTDAARLVVSVCLFGTPANPTKTDEPIEMPFGGMTHVAQVTVTIYYTAVPTYRN